MDSDTILLDVTDRMDKALENLEKKFTTVRAGRANPSSLDGIMVEYYGVMTPLKQLANISVPEARKLQVKPYDKSCLSDIEKGIYEADLGLTPNNTGDMIFIAIPELTEDRRKELVKQAKGMAEEAKVALRNIRQDAMSDVKKLELSEDEEKRAEQEVQELINKYNKIVEDVLSSKEEELMTI